MVSHLITHLGRGGAERYISDLAQYSIESTMPMEIVCLYNTHDSITNLKRVDGKVKIKTFVDLSHLSYVSSRVRLIKILILLGLPYFMILYAIHLRKNQISVVILSLSIPSLFIVLRFFAKRVKFVHLFHTNWHLLTLRHKILFSLSFFLGKNLVTEIGGHEMGKVLAGRFKMGHSYIPFSIISKLPKYIRNDYEGSKCRIFTVCRIRRFEKRLDEMIALCIALRDRNFRFSFDFFGNGEDFIWLQKQIELHQLEDYITLHGFTDIEDVPLNSFDFGIFTSVRGETGIAGLEVESAGCPVLLLETTEGYDESMPFHSKDGGALAMSLIRNHNKSKSKNESHYNNMQRTFSKWQELFQSL
jgi:glycosyltransferase involved in cell wall biosynthesis